MKQVIYQQSDMYPFYKEFSLQAVTTVTGQHILRIIHTKDQKKTSMDMKCMHFQVVDIRKELFDGKDGNQEQQTEDQIKELENKVNAASGDKVHFDTRMDGFIATSNWVKGIADTGLDRLLVEQHIDNPHNIIPTILGILHFMIQTDPEVIPYYLELISKTCRFEDDWHLPSLKQNLLNLLTVIAYLDDDRLAIDFLRMIARERYPDDAFDASSGPIAKIYQNTTIRKECGFLRLFQYTYLSSPKSELQKSTKYNCQIHPFSAMEKLKITARVFMWIGASILMILGVTFLLYIHVSNSPVDTEIEPMSPTITVLLNILQVFFMLFTFSSTIFFLLRMLFRMILRTKINALPIIAFYYDGLFTKHQPFWKTCTGTIAYDGKEYPVTYHTVVELALNDSPHVYHTYLICHKPYLPPFSNGYCKFDTDICTLRSWNIMAKRIHPDLEDSDFSKITVYSQDHRDITSYTAFSFYL